MAVLIMTHLPDNVGFAEGRFRPSRTEPAARPSWALAAPEPTAKEIYFVGLSRPDKSESAAYADAKQNAMSQIANFVGMNLSTATFESRNRRSDADAGQVFVEGDDVSESFSDVFISRTREKGRFVEKVGDPVSKKSLWVAYLLMASPREEIERATAVTRERRERDWDRLGSYSAGAVVYQEETSAPFASTLRDTLSEYLSKAGIIVLDHIPPAAPRLPMIRASIRVDMENTVYDRQFITARIVLRVQRNETDAVTATERVITGTQRSYAHTVEQAFESAVDNFLKDRGRELLIAIRY